MVMLWGEYDLNSVPITACAWGQPTNRHIPAECRLSSVVGGGGPPHTHFRNEACDNWRDLTLFPAALDLCNCAFVLAEFAPVRKSCHMICEITVPPPVKVSDVEGVGRRRCRGKACPGNTTSPPSAQNALAGNCTCRRRCRVTAEGVDPN